MGFRVRAGYGVWFRVRAGYGVWGSMFREWEEGLDMGCHRIQPLTSDTGRDGWDVLMLTL